MVLSFNEPDVLVCWHHRQHSTFEETEDQPQKKVDQNEQHTDEQLLVFAPTVWWRNDARRVSPQ